MNIKKAATRWIWVLVLTPMSVWGQQTFNTRITYDNLAQIEQFEFSDGSCVFYEYVNEIGVASKVTFQAEGSSTMFVDGVGLNESGLVKTVTIDGGQKSYDFDSLNQLVEQRFDFGGTTYYWAKNMAYNHWGGLKNLQRQDPSVNAGIQYGYTDQGQLRSINLANQTATYRYDRFGNLTSVDGFNQQDDLVIPDYAAGANTYDDRNRNADWEYDNAGRLLRDDTKRYYYNALGRLAMVRDLATGIPLQSILYDGSGFRVRTADIRRGSITYTLRDASGGIITQRVDHADGPDQTTHFITHNGETIGEMTRNAGNPAFEKTQIFNDHLGSPVVVVKEAEIINYEYGPFGTQLSEPKSTGAHGYTGHEDDKATGLTYMKARTYDSTRSRFLTPDPARDFDPYLPSTLNLYQYVYNNPLNLLDPTGLVAETGRELMERWAAEAFANDQEFLGYSYTGLSGFLGTADGMSRVANNWVFGQQDQLTGWDYFGAVLNLLEILPVFKWTKLKKVGKTPKSPKVELKFGDNDLVLGLNEGGSLQEFVKQFGGKTFAKFDVPKGAFDDQIKAALDQAEKIRFNLDGVDLKRISGKLNEIGEPINGYTNFELFLLKNNSKYLTKTTFIKDGKVVDSPFQ